MIKGLSFLFQNPRVLDSIFVRTYAKDHSKCNTGHPSSTPLLINGSVCPVTGNTCKATAMFTKACMIMGNPNPKTKFSKLYRIYVQ